MLLSACQTTQMSVGALPPAPLSASGPLQAVVLASTAMPSGMAEAAPDGYVAFCRRDPADCATSSDTRTALTLDPDAWSTIVRVNAETNAAIMPVEDAYHYGRSDYWTIPRDGMGDCEDYALAKRKALIAAGLPPLALRLAVATTAQGEPHAVLTVATDRGDYVLDNRTANVLPWTATDLTWIARQAPGTTSWVALAQPSGSLAVASIR
jgi:predicted transglutaminase-like cysteine proteinase